MDGKGGDMHAWGEGRREGPEGNTVRSVLDAFHRHVGLVEPRQYVGDVFLDREPCNGEPSRVVHEPALPAGDGGVERIDVDLHACR